MNAENTVGHLLYLLAATKSWTQCPLAVVSHYEWKPGLDTAAERLAWGEEYREPVERICGCDPDDGGTGCQRKYRECWGAFVEQAPEWWWDVLTDRPEPKRQEEPPTLF